MVFCAFYKARWGLILALRLSKNKVNNSTVACAGTLHKLIKRVFVPATTKARLKPKIPSPALTFPIPV